MIQGIENLLLDFYNTSISMQTIPTVKVDYLNWCVQNQFMQAINNNILKPCLQALKIPAFVFDDTANKIGIVAKHPKYLQTKDINLPVSKYYSSTQDTAIVNLFGYKGWFDSTKSLMEEVAEVQWHKAGFKEGYKASNGLNKMFFTDYLLSSAICYVEVFKGSTVEKFYATRNVNLLAQLALNTRPTVDSAGNVVGEEKAYIKINKDLSTSLVRTQYEKYLGINTENVKRQALSYIKLTTPTKKTQTYNVVIPRGALSQIEVGMQYRIMPVYFIQEINRMLEQLLQNNLVEITYVKDNLQLRKFITTINPKILYNMIQNKERVLEILKTVSFNDNTRGFIRLPDVTLIGTDSCIRAVDLRICSIKILDIQSYKNAYVDVDLQKVPNVFRMYLCQYQNDKEILLQIYTKKEIIGRQEYWQQKQNEYNYYMKEANKKDVYQTEYLKLANAVQQEVIQKERQLMDIIQKNITIKNAAEIYTDLIGWMTYGVNTLSTTFLQMLHMLMVQNPQIFKNYKEQLQQNNVVGKTQVSAPVSMQTSINLGDI
jgi:hypothetical protein